jgi:catechol 2,3-dioxygenase-like lactoylglutathione lyase family enzyme
MAISAEFAHVNIIAHDWQRLAGFYHDVFGCQPLLPVRDLQGRWLDEATGLPGAHIQGVHLRLPGHGPQGPTLEVFAYDEGPDCPATAVNRPGLAHIAFRVEDVTEAVDAVLSAGGGRIGDIVSVDVPGAGSLTFCYATDPEGNILELQRWAQPPATPPEA